MIGGINMAKIITSDEFKSIINRKGITVIDFFATWCSPCAMMAPIFEQASEENPGAAFYKIDIDENRETAEMYGIESIPTIVFFSDGKEFERIVGVTSAERIKSTIKKAGISNE